MLANASLLVHPNPSASLNISCDASGFAVGGVLQQCVDNVWQPLSFFSKKLSPAETRYSAFYRELLAVYATIRHFRHKLKSRICFVNTDHKPLDNDFNSRAPQLRQTRFILLVYIAEFTSDIRYVKVETNFVADALSWSSVSSIRSDSIINYKELSEDQALGAKFIGLPHSTSFTLEFKLLKSFDNVFVWCDVSTEHARPYITANFQRKV